MILTKNQNMIPQKLFYLLLTLSVFSIILLYLSLGNSSHLIFTEKKRLLDNDQVHLKENQIHLISVQKMKEDLIVNNQLAKIDMVNVNKVRGENFVKPNIVPVVYRRDASAFQKYLEYLQMTEEELPLQTKGVILLTNYRSGSSFVGEFFNQHPDIFYSFEPLIAISHHDSCTYNIPMKQRILAELLQCIVPNYRKYYDSIPRRYRSSERIKNIFTCTKRKFCFIPFTKGLCDEPHCPRSKYYNASNPVDCWRDCGDINPNLVSNMCRRKSLVALKLIRLCDIMHLETLIVDYKLDLKIVHLIRDPRGIAASRLQLHRTLNTSKSLKETCRRQGHNLDVGLVNKPKWLESRYKVIRYEDAALNPFKVAADLYEFIGVKFRKEVADWLEENTGQLASPDWLEQHVDSNSQSEIEDATKNIPILKEPRDPYSHKRNSKTVIQKWKMRMFYTRVKRVESVCKEVMKKVGYREVKSIFEYKNHENNYLLNVTLS